MAKSLKRIVIAGGAVIVLALAFVLLKFVFPEPEEAEALETAPPATEEPVYYLFQGDSSSVKRFVSHYDDGSRFTIDISERDGGYSFTANPPDPFFSYNTSKFRSMMYTMTSLSATALIEEDAQDLSIYGLETPQFQLEIQFSDGSDVRILVGSVAPLRQHYYAMTDRSRTVYTIGSYLAELIMRRPADFRRIDSFPTYEGEDVYLNLTRVALTRRDGTEVEVVLDEEMSMEGNKSSSAYMMTAPVRSSCADDHVEELLDKLATIRYVGAVTDIDSGGLRDYGLDRPARLHLYDKLGNALDLVVGSTYERSCYAVLGAQYDEFCAGTLEQLTVLQYTQADFGWTELDYMSLLNRAIWIVSIRDVASVTYDFAGELYDMELYEYDDVTGSGAKVVRVASRINGKEIHETNTKRIYSRTLNFRVVSTIAPGTVYDEDYTYSIVLHRRDGTEHSMTMHRINDRQYACIVDGVPEYYVYQSNVDTLITALQRAMDDREVSLTYKI